MSMDDKLSQWREKTGELLPPATLVRELEQAVVTPRPARSRAPVIALAGVVLLLSGVGALSWHRRWAGADAPATEPARETPVVAPPLPVSPAENSRGVVGPAVVPTPPSPVATPGVADANPALVPPAVLMAPPVPASATSASPVVAPPAQPVHLVAPVVPASATRPPARELERVLTPVVPPCPPKPEQSLYAVPAPNDLNERAAALRPLLETAPLTCDAQLEAIEMVSAHGAPTAAQLLALDARRAVLCGLGQTAWPTRAPAWRPRPPAGGVGRCDPALWCRVPDCDVKTEACQRALDARPERACEVLEARRRLFDLACVRLLQGALTQKEAEAEFARLNLQLAKFSVRVARPWCLAPEARAEAKALLERGAKP